MYSDMYFSIPGLFKPDPHNMLATIQISKASIPASFYLITALNNTLNFQYTYELDDEPVIKSGTLLLPIGNYDYNGIILYLNQSLAQELNAANPDGITFDVVVNPLLNTAKMEFTITQEGPDDIPVQTFSFLATSSCFSFLGFLKGTTVDFTFINFSFSKISDIVCNFLGTNSLIVISDQLLNFQYNLKTNQRYFWQISNQMVPLGEYFYSNDDKIMHILDGNRNIDGLTIRWVDFDGLPIDFNGCEWMMMLQVNIYLASVTKTDSASQYLNNMLIDSSFFPISEEATHQARKRRNN